MRCTPDVKYLKRHVLDNRAMLQEISGPLRIYKLPKCLKMFEALESLYNMALARP